MHLLAKCDAVRLIAGVNILRIPEHERQTEPVVRRHSSEIVQVVCDHIAVQRRLAFCLAVKELIYAFADDEVEVIQIEQVSVRIHSSEEADHLLLVIPEEVCEQFILLFIRCVIRIEFGHIQHRLALACSAHHRHFLCVFGQTYFVGISDIVSVADRLHYSMQVDTFVSKHLDALIVYLAQSLIRNIGYL